MSFEIKDHDGLGRLGVLTVNNKSITTPNIAVVINPNDLTIPPEEMMRDFGVDLIITNAYIIKNSKKAKDIEAKGLHEYLNFPGIIYTDSGTYQMFSKGGAAITNEETLAYQTKIGSDIHTPLDLFTLPDDDRATAVSKLTETIKRIKAIRTTNFSAPIQGGSFMDLRAKACKELAKVKPTVYPIGGIVPLMISYDFKRLIEVILECKKHLPLNTPVHAFGAGHPLIFALLAYAGVDLFDSASYALYAKEAKYITETGTMKVDELVSLPCNCPICAKHKPSDLRDVGLLARHNLHALMREVRLVRQAIQQDRLFELVMSRAMSHPNVYFAFKRLLEYKELISEHNPIRKRNALFWTGALSSERPEINYANNQLKLLKLKKAPKPLKLVYPFGQNVGWSIDYSVKNYDDLATLRLMADYQFGAGAGLKLIPDNVTIIKSRNQRLHEVLLKNELLFIVRARDGYFALHKAGAKRLKQYLKKVVAPDEYKEFYQKGGDVFAKHVLKANNIKPREEVGVYCGKELVGVGEATLSSREMIVFDKGVAVKTREGIK
ncbi:MAG: tRNA guanosine(15) transglycosylase TgtA [Candidatus Nanoarchaeia archaeon]|jgi:7-cyano-7-deazaguanine tRNA-ribosyltransferase